MRRPMNRNHSRKNFTKNANRVHPKNFTQYPRGGIRL